MPARDLLLVLVVCFAWAGNFLMSAFALRELPSFLFTALRMLLLGLVLLPWLRRPPPGQWRRLLGIALCVGVLHFGLSFASLKVGGDIASPAIVMQSYVPMALLLAWWMRGERFAWRTGSAIAVSFVGVLVLGFDPLVLDAPLAMGLMLVSAFFMALGSVWMRDLEGVGAFTQLAWTAWIALPCLALCSLLLEAPTAATFSAASWLAWAGVAYSALVASLVGHGIYFRLLQRHPMALVAPWLLLAPLLAVGLGVWVWGDRPGPRLWIGAALVLGGVLAIALRTWVKSRASATASAPSRPSRADATTSGTGPAGR